MQLQERFRQLYHRAPRLFQAPGRVNLIGEHTDYNDGFVLPLAIDRATCVAGAARVDGVVRANSLDFGEQIEFKLTDPAQRQRGSWADYVEGVARILLETGVPLQGADLLIESTVPVGSGLSSSAALEIAVGLALTSLAHTKLDALTLARVGQRAEHEYVGARVGLMDQLAAVYGRRDTALLIDCRSLEITHLPLPTTDVAIVVCDSRVKHDLAASEYNLRRTECELGVALLRPYLPGIQALRDVSVEALQRHVSRLPATLARRCRHVVTENERTLAAAEALRLGHWETLGRLMNASHESLRDDYEVSCAELDLLVQTAQQLEGVLGARMTGGGFGGCTVNLVRAAAVAQFSATLAREYQRSTGLQPSVYQIRAGAGAAELLAKAA